MTRRHRSPLQAEALDRRDCPAVFGVPWPTPNLTLSFAPDGTNLNGSPSRLTTTLDDAGRAEVLRAFQAWASVANVNVGLTSDGGQPIGTAGGLVRDPRFGDIRIAAIPLDGVAALALPFDLTAGTRSGDVWFNSNLPFGTGASSKYDVFTVALHEAGHVFGVGGSDDPASATGPFPAAPRTGLSAADVAAIRALYGPRESDAFDARARNETLDAAPEVQPTGGHGPSNTIRLTADLTAPGDIDVYRFRPRNLDGGGLTATVTVAGYSLLVPRVEILDATGTVIAAGVGDRPGAGNVVLPLTGVEEGDTYFVRVSAGSATFGVGGYKLAIVPDATDDDDDDLDDEVNENDSDDRATVLGRQFEKTGPRLDYALSAGLSTPTDVDVYRLRSPQEDGDSAGVMTVLVWSADGTLDPIIEVADSFGTPVPGTVLVRDSGAYTLQLPDAAAEGDYLVRVRHARPWVAATAGNYLLAVDFGGQPVTLPELASGTLTAAAPVASRELTVAPNQVLHLVLGVTGADPAAGVRLSVLNAAGGVVESRFAAAGETVSLTPYLPAGTYQLLVAGGTTVGTTVPNLSYTVRGVSVSDPIGPRSVDVIPTPIGPVPPPTVPPNSRPAVPPSVTVTPPRPLTPVTPVEPTSPNWLVLPPTDWPAPPGTALRPAPKPLPRTISAGAGAGGAVRSFAADGSERFAVIPFAGFTGGVRVAEADFNADGVPDLIAGTGPGGSSHVRILDGRTQAELFAVDPFEASFSGGVYVAAGDVTGDGVPDLVITPDEGGGPRVRIFGGADFQQLADFFGIDDVNFRGGARAAVGDLSGDGRDDLIVVAGFGGGPRVAGYDGTSLGGTPAHLFGDFFAFEQTLRNGVFVAAGDIDGDGFAELIAGGGLGGGPRVTAFGGKALLANVQDVRANFFAGDVTGRGGVRVAVKDFDADGRADVVVGAGAGAGTRVTAYRGVDLGQIGTPPEMMAFDVFAGSANGIFVG